MADDLVLRSHPNYRHLFQEQKAEPKPEILWGKAHGGIVNSQCCQYQVRKTGTPPIYDLYSVRVLPFARLIKGGFASFEAVKDWLRRQP